MRLLPRLGCPCRRDRSVAVLFALARGVAACCALTACASLTSPQQHTLTADARLQVAEAADASGDSELASSMYIQAAVSEPSNIALQMRCADALARYGKLAQARQILTERLRSNPGQPDLTRALALIDLIGGRPEQAIAGLDQVLAANPADLNALVDKAVALDLLGQHTAAQAIYTQVLATTPDDAATRNDLAMSQMLQGRTSEALQTLVPMQNADTSPQRLKVNLGILYAATGDHDRSRQLLGDRASDGDVEAIARALASSTQN
jgi:Flp pilus assembly protein TadD